MPQTLSTSDRLDHPVLIGLFRVGVAVAQLIRYAVLVVLLLAEPFLGIVLGTLAILGVFSALFLRFAGAHFRFWELLGASLACVLVWALVNALIKRLSDAPGIERR